MSKPYQLALHIFRRDLRLQDNTALIDALKSADKVIPCFIFDPRQIEQNDYKSENCILFMLNSLQDLDDQLKLKMSHLYYFYGQADAVVTQLMEQLPIDAVFLNRDYTPFSIERDKRIANYCAQRHIDFHSHADLLLQEPEQVLKPNREPYSVYTHFYNRASQLPVRAPCKNMFANYYQLPIASEDKIILPKLARYQNPNLFVKGGRKEGIGLVKKMASLSDYDVSRNIPAAAGTSKLSAHNKFGTVSIREVYASIKNYFGAHHTLIKELYWRDFFTHVTFHYPYVLGQAFQQKYANIPWPNNLRYFRAWCEGQTGFPIVDAGMRELNTTGYMHNRVRMITASFLVKDLQIDWRLGEKYFAQKLIDYDPAVNNGNWQWAASTGCDAQPYFRIFNPWLQQEKFDPDCLYIKRWIPELATVPNKTLHALATHSKPMMRNYPQPIVDHSLARDKAKQLYQNEK